MLSKSEKGKEKKNSSREIVQGRRNMLLRCGEMKGEKTELRWCVAHGALKLY